MKLGLALLLTAVFFTLSVSSATITNEQLIDFDSPYTVPFTNYISSAQLPAGKSLSLATMSVRFSGHALLNQNGSVSRSFVQDVSELPMFPNASAYFIDVLRAVPAEPAPAYYATATGINLGHVVLLTYFSCCASHTSSVAQLPCQRRSRLHVSLTTQHLRVWTCK